MQLDTVMIWGGLSTHILTRRMTAKTESKRECDMPFNSHPHKEDDRTGTETGGTEEAFNSHPHKEDDRKKIVRDDIINLSTHILTRRMTARTEKKANTIRLSTHILTRRMTIMFLYVEDEMFLSTHILTRRMTDGIEQFVQSWVLSTHILTRRMTQWIWQMRRVGLTFNSHPHKEDD